MMRADQAQQQSGRRSADAPTIEPERLGRAFRLQVQLIARWGELQLLTMDANGIRTEDLLHQLAAGTPA